jgi:hypothetical protein
MREGIQRGDDWAFSNRGQRGHSVVRTPLNATANVVTAPKSRRLSSGDGDVGQKAPEIETKWPGLCAM